MVNRIQEILKRYNLSPSRFADELEVPRSTISHILSERNKPSLEFIQKVLDHYPDISTNWLVKGEGSIFGRQVDLFSDLEQHDQETKTQISQTKKNDTDSKVAGTASEGPQVRHNDKYENIRRESSDKGEPEVPQNQSDIKEKRINISPRKITRIITFFDDHTFEEYLPSRSNDL